MLISNKNELSAHSIDNKTGMATYTEQQKQEILSYPIEEFLRVLGKRTEHRGEMYYSPFRDEENPSFHINRQKNVWMDFGLGKGGNILTLVQMLLGVKGAEAWDILSSQNLSDLFCLPCHEQARPEGKLTIREVSDHFCTRLISYSKSRGIPADILSRYCKQVSYCSGSSDRVWTSIGFPNAAGGWVLRNDREGAYSKITTISMCSYLNAEGQQCKEAVHSHIEVFEGFFDFMSWLILSGKVVPGCDVCVLNSVNNLERSMEFISAHQSISCWFDCDHAGMEAYSRLHGTFPKSADHFFELSSSGCKDVNELLLKILAE